MDFDKDKDLIPEFLKNSINEKKLVIFVGAGLSRSAGLPDWKKITMEILAENIKTISKATGFYSALENDVMTPLEVLDKIQNDKKIILEGFERKLKIKDNESKIHRTLSEISRKIITTNFDKLIESNSSIENIITHDSQYNLSKIDDHDEFILKIHGDINQADKCIIFTNQFDELYKNESLGVFQLQKLLSENTCLFVGFSFQDPYVKELFDYIQKKYNGFGKNNFIISTNEIQIPGIRTIKLSNYDELPAYFNKLATLSPYSLEKTKEVTEKSAPFFTNILSSAEMDGSDIPPLVSSWVGRERELQAIQRQYYKVIFITGFGGEGKSALASQAFSMLQTSGDYSIYDWRDFKEEEHNFHYKILSMIRLVSSDFNLNSLSGLDDEALIQIFFNNLSNKKGLFILDNVDRYIDMETLEPINEIGKFFKAAMKFDHRSIFIFTCRPFIQYATVDFIQLSLKGLTEANTIELFNKPEIPLSKEKRLHYAKVAHNLTKGHALWLNLIMAQALRGEGSLQQFLSNIGSSISSDSTDSALLAETILNKVWSILNERDQKLLKTLAEAVRSETAEDYAEILRDELNYNKFSKSLKTLSNLNLIIKKINSDYIELHPLVKEFVRKNHYVGERSKYIYLLIKYYDKFLIILKEKLSHKLNFKELSGFTNKAELAINAADYQEAINSLKEVYSAINAAGYTEEYLRVCKIFLNSFSWSKNSISKIANLDVFLNDASSMAAEYGDIATCNLCIEKFESVVEGKDEKYIQLCKMKAFSSWAEKKYDTAINICEEALYLLERTNQPDKYHIENTYALSLRDSGEPKNISKALKLFTKNISLETLLDQSEKITDKFSASTYGNIGKCLALNNNHADALTCYYKSFYCVMQENDANRLINFGHVSKWIFESLHAMGENLASYYFLKFALDSWESTSPYYYGQTAACEPYKKAIGAFVENGIKEMDKWRIEKYCIDWVNSNSPYTI
ncbi:hypothetical protein WN53_03320 [Serratia fonticola]|uniref:SIR2 family protein n=2 Tax=Serratia fonticola TaxID=47917 RepID=UPI00062A42A6|nr:SIR2 family protein [Serratia fonticola]AKG68237.1 hypothetical protein WN53_03320 [Serratia fonticola]CAI1522909.1 NB-ARC domain [Serratia fonticola]